MGLIITFILLGLIFMFVEILIIPGVGFAGILGVISMGGSCYYAFHEYDQTAGFIVLGVNVVLLLIMIIWALSGKTWKKAALDTNITAKANVPEIAVQVGDKGVAATRLAPMGNVRFGTHVVEVAALEGMINSGSQVEVVIIDNNKIYVKECK